MKIYIKTILITCTLAIAFFACEQDEIDTYNGKDLVYFQWAKDGGNNYEEARLDSTSFSFAFELPALTDSVYNIPVKTQGFISNQDRSFLVKIGENSEATQGSHFDLPDNFVIPANSEIGSIPLTLYRSADLKTDILSLELELIPNENFNTDLIGDDKSSNSNKVLSYNTFELTFSDMLTQPNYWNSLPVYYLGDFSVKKMYVFAEVNNIPVPNWDEEFIYGDFLVQKDIFQAYIRTQKATGTPVLEEDGTEMELGDY